MVCQVFGYVLLGIRTLSVLATIPWLIFSISSVVSMAFARAVASFFWVWMRTVVFGFMFVSRLRMPGAARFAPWHIASTAVSRIVILGRSWRAFSMGCMNFWSHSGFWVSFHFVW